MAQRPIAHRVFSVLVAVLLVTSMVAPIAAQPAAASTTTAQEIDGSWDGTCESIARFVLPISCGFADDRLSGFDETQSGHYLQSDMYAHAQSTEDAWRSTYVLTGNYLEDTPTIASLEAKNAIAFDRLQS